jgi:hypothetical protein
VAVVVESAALLIEGSDSGNRSVTAYCPSGYFATGGSADTQNTVATPFSVVSEGGEPFEPTAATPGGFTTHALLLGGQQGRLIAHAVCAKGAMG